MGEHPSVTTIKCNCDAAMWRKMCQEHQAESVRAVERLRKARKQRDEARALAANYADELARVLVLANRYAQQIAKFEQQEKRDERAETSG